jgi:RNA polymerase sigma-70 factor (ECF subfamily)
LIVNGVVIRPGGVVTRAAEFDEFYAYSYGRVFGQLYAMTGDVAMAEDAAAEAFARAWQRWSSVRRADSSEAWVRTVAVRVAISAWRKSQNRRAAHWRSAEQQADPPGLGPDHVALVQALRELPAGQRQAIVLHYFADAPVRQIAHDLGVSEGTVKSWLARGRRALGERLDETAEVSGDGRS